MYWSAICFVCLYSITQPLLTYLSSVTESYMIVEVVLPVIAAIVLLLLKQYWKVLLHFGFKPFSLHLHPFALLLSCRTTQANLIPLLYDSPKILKVSLHVSLTLFFSKLRSLGVLFLFSPFLVQYYTWPLVILRIVPVNSSLSYPSRPPSPIYYLKPLPSQCKLISLPQLLLDFTLLSFLASARL